MTLQTRLSYLITLSDIAKLGLKSLGPPLAFGSTLLDLQAIGIVGQWEL